MNRVGQYTYQRVTRAVSYTTEIRTRLAYKVTTGKEPAHF